MKKDLKSMSTKQLEKHLEDVKKALAESKSKDKRAALKAAEKAAAEFGFSLNDLSGSKLAEKKARKPRKKAANVGVAKYANPDDAGQTWTGKGRQPNWYIRAIESGKSPEDMEIS